MKRVRPTLMAISLGTHHLKRTQTLSVILLVISLLSSFLSFFLFYFISLLLLLLLFGLFVCFACLFALHQSVRENSGSFNWDSVLRQLRELREAVLTSLKFLSSNHEPTTAKLKAARWKVLTHHVPSSPIGILALLLLKTG